MVDGVELIRLGAVLGRTTNERGGDKRSEWSVGIAAPLGGHEKLIKELWLVKLFPTS